MFSKLLKVWVEPSGLGSVNHDTSDECYEIYIWGNVGKHGVWWSIQSYILDIVQGTFIYHLIDTYFEDPSGVNNSACKITFFKPHGEYCTPDSCLTRRELALHRVPRCAFYPINIPSALWGNCEWHCCVWGSKWQPSSSSSSSPLSSSGCSHMVPVLDLVAPLSCELWSWLERDRQGERKKERERKSEEVVWTWCDVFWQFGIWDWKHGGIIVLIMEGREKTGKHNMDIPFFPLLSTDLPRVQFLSLSLSLCPCWITSMSVHAGEGAWFTSHWMHYAMCAITLDLSWH